MSGWRKALERPQNLWLRKALFQVHLWVGIGIGLYILLIGITGSILVFREEMQHAMESPRLDPSSTQGEPADILAVAGRMRAAFPDRTLTSIGNPVADRNTIRAYLRKGETYLAVDAHPVTGAILGAANSDTSFLRWLQLLHFNLLAGATGRIVNGVGAIFLLVLCLSGMIIWWPGIRNWKRGLTVDFSKKWKRLNWDLHSAAGFWTMSVLAMWAVTGAYFAWPTEYRTFINWFSPVSLAKVAPPDSKQKGKFPPPDLRALLAEAQAKTPGGTLLSLSLPVNDRGHIRIFIAREKPAAYESADYHYFDPFTGKHVAVWRNGLSKTAGDVIVSWIGPLHFGTFAGHGPARMGVKIVWVILGLAPPLLMITGFLMYWNRYLSKKWAKLRKPRTKEARTKEVREEIPA